MEYVPCTDDEAMGGISWMYPKEGIIPALESLHAIAYALKSAKTMSKDQSIIVNLSGRGDKDLHTVMKRFDWLLMAKYTVPIVNQTKMQRSLLKIIYDYPKKG